MAEKVPAGSEPRKSFDAEILLESQRLAARHLGKPPTGIRITQQVLVSFLIATALGLVLVLLDDRGLVGPLASSLGKQLGVLVTEQQQAAPGVLGWEVSLAIVLINLAWLLAAILCACVLLARWLQRTMLRRP